MLRYVALALFQQSNIYIDERIIDFICFSHYKHWTILLNVVNPHF